MGRQYAALKEILRMAEPEKTPTSEELAKLPRWARVAFAARCARRVQVLLQKYWKAVPKHHVEAIDEAVRLSERSAATANVGIAVRGRDAAGVIIRAVIDNSPADTTFANACFAASNSAAEAANSAAETAIFPGHAAHLGALAAFDAAKHAQGADSANTIGRATSSFWWLPFELRAGTTRRRFRRSSSVLCGPRAFHLIARLRRNVVGVANFPWR